MKIAAKRVISRINVGLLISTTLSLTTAVARDAVPWTDLPKKIGHGKMRTDEREDRQYRVVMKDGSTHFGYKIIFSSNGVRLDTSGPELPRDQIVEIGIHRDGLLTDEIFTPARKFMPAARDDYDIRPLLLMPVLLPFLLGVTAATAPVVLPIQGVKRLLPDKVIKVAP